MNSRTAASGATTFDTIFVHLLNDFSGSPKVLRQVIDAVSADHRRGKLFVGKSTEGILSRCGIPTQEFPYRRSRNKLGTLAYYLLSQAVLFVELVRDRTVDRNAVVYVNTLLPFGAALYGRVTGRKVIYHIHEFELSPRLLNWFLARVARSTSTLGLFVSGAHLRACAAGYRRTQRIHNALDEQFVAKARRSEYAFTRNGLFNVLMIASLRDYKGIPELLGLAESLRMYPDIHFDLLVNDDQRAVDCYFNSRRMPANLSVATRTLDTAAFYAKASLVLNLSRVDQWVETFGMTILEGLAFGIPVIAPPAGGPCEIVDDGIEGFLVDSRDARTLMERVMSLYQSPELCMQMSRAARERASKFSQETFATAVTAAIDSVRGDPT